MICYEFFLIIEVNSISSQMLCCVDFEPVGKQLKSGSGNSSGVLAVSFYTNLAILDVHIC